MLRLGLTGNLGSGKSTVAALLAARGAYTLSSDAIGRGLMQPGEHVFRQIVSRFGLAILAADGALNRKELARLAFTEGYAEDLNSLVHPAVIARQAELTDEIFSRDPNAIVVVESALLFETRHAGSDWHTRFDRILLVTAPESEKIARFIRRQHSGVETSPGERQALEAEARSRLALQIPDHLKAQRADYVISNEGTLTQLHDEVNALWPTLEEAANEARPPAKSLQ